MTELVISQNKIELFTQNAEQYLDKVVEYGSDQELFIASYLQGHFAVVAGQSQVQQMRFTQELAQLMNTSLQSAFDNNELSEDDQNQVKALWESLLAL